MRLRSLLILSCLSAALSHAGSLRPGIPRVTWTTDHFTLTIDEKKQDLLPRLGSLAEECYAKQSAFFGYAPPGRIQMVFLDEQDYANGMAYPPQQWVVIYLHGADHRLRGRTRWLPGVISHELGHIFTLRKMGEDSRFLGMELFHDWRGAGGSRFRESLDWTYGRVPPWLAEGLAQYAAGVCGYDTLDSHRRMVLRVAAASGALMTPAELKGFAWDGRRDEMIYTQGYSLVSHLYKTYGPRKANRYLALAAARGWRHAFKPAFGKNLAEIYSEWRKALESQSRSGDAAGDDDYLLEETPGPYNVESSPIPLAKGRLLYLSSRDNDYARTDLVLAEGNRGLKRVFRNATSAQPAGGNSALFTATRYDFFQGDVISELYRYDGESGSVDRLTHGGRVIRGCETQGIVYGVRNNEGRTSVIRIAEGEYTTVYTPPDTLELTDIAAGRAPGTLTLGATSGFGGDLYELNLASRELSPLAISPQDERDPHWAGDTLYFSADYGGVFDVYALAGEQVTRITHVSGGAFHPIPVDEGILFSAYGWKGFRLARARPAGKTAPPFTVELPVPAWPLPPLAEYEADTYDHTHPGLLGFDLSLGIIRRPGFSLPGDSSDVDTATFTATSPATSPAISSDPGSKAVTTVGLHWKTPTEVVSASARLGLSKPLDYEGPMHLDATAFELRVNAFLPAIVVGGDWNTYDIPGFRYYEVVVSGYAGLDIRLADYWSAFGRVNVANVFAYAGEENENVYDSDPQFGGAVLLDYAKLDYGKDGIVRGFSAFLGGGIPPRIDETSPDFSVDAGATLYRSLRRLLFLSGSLYHSEDWGHGGEAWVYGDASAYGVIPLGLQLGTRGGAGLYLDQAYPGIEYLGATSVPVGDAAGYGYRPGYQARYPWAGPGRGLLPKNGFFDMLGKGASHEIGVFLSLKTLGFFANPETWKVGLRFDAEDFGREPVWSVFITL